MLIFEKVRFRKDGRSTPLLHTFPFRLETLQYRGMWTVKRTPAVLLSALLTSTSVYAELRLTPPSESTQTPPRLIGGPGEAPFPFTPTSLTKLKLHGASDVGPSRLAPLLRGCKKVEELTLQILDPAILRHFASRPRIVTVFLPWGPSFAAELEVVREELVSLSAVEQLLLPWYRGWSEVGRKKLDEECGARGITVTWRGL